MRAALRQFRQKRISLGSLVNNGGLAEADMHRRLTRNPIERRIKRLYSVFPRLLRACLHIRFVNLHDIGARRE